MSQLSYEKKRRLLDAVKKIHSHKSVQIMGYKKLISIAKDDRIRHLLNLVVEEEERIEMFWSEQIKELEGSLETTSYLFNLKTKILMRVLGTKGFFEWALVGEEEGIRDLALQAGTIRDTALSQTWSRFASEERMHLEKIRTQVLGMDSWKIRGGSGVRDMTTIFSSSYSGLISTLAFVTGVFGALMNRQIVIMSGFASIFAGSISNGAGSYQSSLSEVEALVRESKIETNYEMRQQVEREQLLDFYRSEGYSRREAEALVSRLESTEYPFKTGALEEIGLAPKEIGTPFKSAFLSGASFCIASIVPLLPFTLKSLKITDALIISIVLTLASLFSIGAIKTLFTRKNWVRSGLDVVIFGASASTFTYLIGTLFSQLF